MSGTFGHRYILLAAGRLVALCLLFPLIFWGAFAVHDYVERVADSNLCVEDWFGKSWGNLITLLSLLLFFLLVSGFTAPVFVDGYRAWRYRCVAPRWKKSRLRTPLIEGAAAARWGREQIATGAIVVMALWAIGFYAVFPQAWRSWLIPVSAIKECQAPQHTQKISSIQENSP